jgi:hypothetical protein
MRLNRIVHSVDGKNEETLKNLRTYATYVLPVSRAYPSTLSMARSNLVRQFL